MLHNHFTSSKCPLLCAKLSRAYRQRYRDIVYFGPSLPTVRVVRFRMHYLVHLILTERHFRPIQSCICTRILQVFSLLPMFFFNYTHDKNSFYFNYQGLELQTDSYTSSVSPACRKRRLKGCRYIAIVADTA